MAYTLTLTSDDIDAILFSGDRYGWSSCLNDLNVEEGDNNLAEHEAWDLQAYLEEDTENFRTSIPLAAPCLERKLLEFCNKIV
jgi:hypothetical protein